MGLRVVVLVFLSLPLIASAHHSHTEFSDEVRELEGELTNFVWRNPHPAMTLRVVGDGNSDEIWRIQVLSNVNGLSRDGVTGDAFRIGERIRISGYLSMRRPTVLLATRARLASGVEIVLGPDEFSGATLYRGNAEAAIGTNAEQPHGIYRVWTVENRIRTLDLPLNDAARAAKVTWDSLLDDPQRGCRPLGMPGAMMSPHPIEIRELGEDILIHLEEWNSMRIVYMGADGADAVAASTPLGFSTGRWEGDVLIVTTTRIDYPYMDEHGTPQSDAVEVTERFSLGPDGRSLNWDARVTDPGTLTEPVIAFTTLWEWIPGEVIQPYDCQELDPL